ncbi:hypothetical protein F4860DRAFT_496554 [Xylaria cubensis]|nr:hypothetical protein F4860DRAFT_496554 [Xylaria cubensis]
MVATDESLLETPYESSLEAADPASQDDEMLRAVETLDDLYHGRYSPSDNHNPPSENVTFTLRKSSYNLLRQRLDSAVLGYFDDKVLSSWNPDTGELTIRTERLLIHEMTLAALWMDIHNKLNEIAEASNGALQSFRDNLTGCGSADIGYRDDSSGHKSPDWQLEYEGWGTTFVLDVAYTQTQATASEYFDLEPTVCTVLVINITSRPEEERLQGCEHRAAFSLWVREGGNSNKSDSSAKDQVPNKREPLVENTVFRENDGQVSQGSLTIPFELLLPPGERTKHPKIQSAGLTFSYKSLATMIRKAEIEEREAEKRYQERHAKNA